jgi:hypothetical protein
MENHAAPANESHAYSRHLHADRLAFTFTRADSQHSLSTEPLPGNFMIGSQFLFWW